MKTHLNLLPWSYRRGRLLRRRLIQWSAAWTLASLVCGGIWWTGYRSYLAAQDAVRWRTEQYEPVEIMRGEIEQLRADIEELSDRETLVGQLAEERPPLTVMGLVSRSARGCDGRVHVERILLNRDGSAGRLGAKAANTPATHAGGDSMLTIHGLGLDHAAVSKFVVQLSRSGAFDHVELKSSLQKIMAGDTLRGFIVECQF